MATVITLPLTRWIVLDDTDERIEYTGPWSVVDGRQFDGIGNFGVTYGGTEHTTTARDASFSFRFNGTSVLFQGTIEANVGSGVTWDCVIDGTAESEAHVTLASTLINNFVFCRYDDLAPGEHAFGVKVTSSGQNLYVDRLAYGALNSLPSSINKVIQVDYNDPYIKYSSNAQWTKYLAYATTTNSDDPGASVSFNFTGTSIAWYTAFPNRAHDASSASYQVDDEEPVVFAIRGFDGVRLNQKYFETPTRESKDHTLTVKYLGNHGAMPLSLGYLEVTNNPGAVTTSAPGVAPSSTAGSGRKLLAPVIGGLVGGLILLSLLAFFIWHRLRFRPRTAVLPPPANVYALRFRSRASSVSSLEVEKKKMGSL